mmetsp:Transcript_11506/g.27596  ORF Transcript_11506/g.27596 Transcript_11506/m.27596 type:complete len:218 (-) Transcript_11506:1157-1810(-)
MEPVVVRSRLHIAGLGLTEKIAHNDRVKLHAMVVRAAEVHRRHMIPSFIQLQGIEVPGVQQLHGEACVLHHGTLRELDRLHVQGIFHLIATIEEFVLRREAALEAGDHGPVVLSKILQELHVEHGLVHGDLADHCKFLHHLRQELGLVAEFGLMEVVLLRVCLVRRLFHDDLHVRDRLKDCGCHLPHLSQELLQWLQHDAGYRVRKHQRKPNHQHHD